MGRRFRALGGPADEWYEDPAPVSPAGSGKLLYKKPILLRGNPLDMQRLLFLFIGLLLLSEGKAQNVLEVADPATNNGQALLKGWNTWNNPSVLSHVKMPEGLNIQLLLRKQRQGPYWLRDSYVASPKTNFAEKIYPGQHAYDGSYTQLELNWEGQQAVVETASDGKDFYLLYQPVESPELPHVLVIETGILWNKPGTLRKENGTVAAEFSESAYRIATTTEEVDFPLPLNTPYFSFLSDQRVALYTGDDKSLEQVEETIAQKKRDYARSLERYGELADAYEAMQSVMAWNLIYDAHNERGIASVSRIWNEAWGGYIIFDWDTYFAALMASVDFKALAYSNALAITNALTEEGFVPNLEATHGLKSFDRSQPPVGSMVCKLIYDRHGEKWFLEQVYDNLLSWNRWWDRKRNNQGYLSWGSDDHPRGMGGFTLQGAKYESGLDNSPLFDDVPFNEDKGMLELASVGLMGLYVADCQYLREIAMVLGKQGDAEELEGRGRRYGKKLQELWDKDTGIFRDKNLVTGAFSPHLAPTNFYPLLGRVATPRQARRMVEEHLMNPEEFYGDWMLPSIARNDPAYPDNSYWRGRIWAPMNFLVYMGLKNYDLNDARQMLADKSRQLLMKEWRGKRRVHENYNADTGVGDDVRNSDSFYSWGGLLGLIPLMEAGYFLDEKP